MNKIETDDLDMQVKDIENTEYKYRRTLRTLLDWIGDKRNHLIAVPTRMGTTKSYITSVSLKWVEGNVSMAKDLPIFKEHISQRSGGIVINEWTRQNIQQRDPDFRRQLPMAVYLATRKYHKFGPLILVAYKDWVYDKHSDQWGSDGRALEPSLSIQPLDSNSFVIDLAVQNTSYFALDGQHRLMAIRGLKELIDGRLEAKQQNGSLIKGHAVTRDEIEEYYSENGKRLGLELRDLEGLLNEQIGVEIIPAVLQGESYEEAISRLRNIFVDVNENAKKLGKGELVMLDEVNGFRIVARTVLTNHPLFRAGDELRVNTKTSNVSEKSNHVTTLSTLVEVTQKYLAEREPFDTWDHQLLGNRKLGYIRPEHTDLEAAQNNMTKYFDALNTIPSHRDMAQGMAIKELRSKEGRDNILFWPITQVALASAIAYLEKEKGKSLEELVGLLSKYEGLEQLRLTKQEAPWFGILCDTVELKIRRHVHYRDLCKSMFIYLLGGGYKDDRERESLRKNFFNARRVTSEESKDPKPRAHSLTGEAVYEEEFVLPDPWQ